eukprot:Skav227027  [mRNA]  locus=scaffold456:250651:251202:+ [translate_table: standard]
MPRCLQVLAGLRGLWQFLLGLCRPPAAAVVAPGPTVIDLSSDSEGEAGPAGHLAAVDWWLVETAPEPSAAVLALGVSSRRGAEASEHIALAYHRGRQAAAIRRGDISAFHGPRCNLRNRYYVVLCTGRNQEAFYTRSFNIYCNEVKLDNGNIDTQAICHGFPSEAEVSAFCLGAGLGALPRFR